MYPQSKKGLSVCILPGVEDGLYKLDLLSNCLQVLIVGDLNIAASQKDVYDKLDREGMYPQNEKDLFASILTDFKDVWRELHPETTNAFTVWDEKTSARAFNEVSE